MCKIKMWRGGGAGAFGLEADAKGKARIWGTPTIFGVWLTVSQKNFFSLEAF
jgi:hypothetical protein